MKTRRMTIRGIFAACAMLVIILDTRTAVASAQDGINMCIRTVIPSLFPFFVLSGIINSCLLGRQLRLLQPLGRLCKIPKGAESLLILGLLVGYPVGAQLITQAYQEGNLPKRTAWRMLGFCNNAGPAFLFGMLSPLFARTKALWDLWAIQIFAVLIVGFLLPAEPVSALKISPSRGVSFPESLQKALKAITGVCGWVIVFRVLLGFCSRWFLWLLPGTAQIIISGLLELANACVLLHDLNGEGARFLLAGAMLSFGGLCVGMQTMSATEGLGTGWYFPGKVLQTILTVLLCLVAQPLLFSGTEAVVVAPSVYIGILFILSAFIFVLRRKKVVAFSGRLLYNTGK